VTTSTSSVFAINSFGYEIKNARKKFGRFPLLGSLSIRKMIARWKVAPSLLEQKLDIIKKIFINFYFQLLHDWF
jgi:hypothetical protein